MVDQAEIKKRTEFVKNREKEAAHQSGRDSTSVKVKHWKIINATNWEYTISTCLGGKTNYLVTIYNVPSCSRPDFRKRGSQIFSKHVIFVFPYILQLKDECL